MIRSKEDRHFPNKKQISRGLQLLTVAANWVTF